MIPYLIAAGLLTIACLFGYFAFRPGPPPMPAPRVHQPKHAAEGLDDPTAKVDPLLARPMWPNT